MTRKRRNPTHGLTRASISGISNPPKYKETPILCTRCKKSTGGTLVKIDTHYEHMFRSGCK